MTQLLAGLTGVALLLLTGLALRWPRPVLAAYSLALGALLLALPLLALGATFQPALVGEVDAWAARYLPAGLLAVLPAPQSPAFFVSLAAVGLAILLPQALVCYIASQPSQPAPAPLAEGPAPPLASQSMRIDAPPRADLPPRAARDIRAAAETMASVTASQTKPQRVADYLS